MPFRKKIFPLLFLLLAVSCQATYSPDESIAAQLPEKVDFNFHIKPILSDRCFSCHGPDKNAVEADLQLHTAEGAREHMLSSGQHAFVSGNVGKSEAFQRMISTDPELQMPPPKFQRNLTPYEIALVAKWISQGAEYKPHWAFIPPAKAEVPRPANKTWSRNEIDHFILKKLEEKGLKPNEEADKETLIRRLTLDLTGLPPTLAEIDDFLVDDSPDAYGKLVDRLLASPHYGERMALFWLDMARYADSNGYSQDGLRIMWPWRDWVIKAFNENMPYDRFIEWQLAGDKIQQASQEQKLATGFLRNHRLNGEGGIVDEEYRVEYAADRTETAATVFLGLTMGCARCHDHKYDPISQEEYYKFFAFFNGVHEMGISANDGNSGPQLMLTSEEVRERIDYLDKLMAEQEKEAELIASGITQAHYASPKPELNKGLIVDLPFDNMSKEGFRNKANRKDKAQLRGQVEQVAGKIGNAVKFTSFDYVNLVNDEIAFDRADPFSFSFFLKSDKPETYIVVLNHLGSQAINYPGYQISLVEGHPTMRLVHELPANLIEVKAKEKLQKGVWTHLTFTYDGSGSASGIDFYLNGQKASLHIEYDKLSQGLNNPRPNLGIGGAIGYQTEVKGEAFLDELKVYNRKLSDIEASALFEPLEKTKPVFSEQQRKNHHLTLENQAYLAIQQKIRKLRQEKFSIQDTLVSVMVMEDLPEGRPTFILTRGVYDAPEKQVNPGMPVAISPVSDTSIPDREGLADWLLDKNHPLTARVAVNRFWQIYFGLGIVKTTDDFGSQGALPSHPELLDNLALRFIESGWDVKAFQKMILMSSTYRQSSRVGAEARARDPENVLLARGPSRRLSAELIRDAALAASGLLVKKIGGPSVLPYQPAGLWEEKGEFSKLKNYNQGKGDDLYRRSLYTFWRRTSPPPSMTTFDAPTRDICIVSRQETNTPLQALVLLNDPQFVEAARVLAERVIRSAPDKKAQIIQAHRLLTGQKPEDPVIDLLMELEQREEAKFAKEPALAQELLSIGEYPTDKELTQSQVAAMTLVSSTIMSFDETLIKR